jgi:hypothetical protein
VRVLFRDNKTSGIATALADKNEKFPLSLAGAMSEKAVRRGYRFVLMTV